jgi:Rrf2 family transcriptional regulator, cysteine metabolism repressor
MFLTTRGHYSMRAMLHLALHHGGAPVPVADIAECEQISRKYLQQLMGSMRRAGLVRVIMGPHGGFELARSPAQISIGAILRAAEGEVVLMHCLQADRVCPRTRRCLSRRIWESASRVLNDFLDSQTLQSALLDQAAESEQFAKPCDRREPRKRSLRKSAPQ